MSELPPQSPPRTHHAVPAELLHDLRTPIGHVIGYAELLSEELKAGGHPEYLPHLQKILTAAQQLIKLMEENFEAVRGADRRMGNEPRS